MHHKIRVYRVRVITHIVEKRHIADVVASLFKSASQQLIHGTNTTQNAITILRNNNIFYPSSTFPFL